MVGRQRAAGAETQSKWAVSFITSVHSPRLVRRRLHHLDRPEQGVLGNRHSQAAEQASEKRQPQLTVAAAVTAAAAAAVTAATH